MTETVTNTNPDPDVEQDPAVLVPPRLDTRIGYGPIPAAQLIYFAPTAVVGLVTYFIGGGVPALVGSGLTVVLALVTLGLILAADETTTPADIVRAHATGAYVGRVHPLTDADAEGLHGVARLYADGTARMADERVVGLVRVDGPGLDHAEAGARRTLTAQLADGLDEDVADVTLRLWSTTTNPDIAGRLRRYDEAAVTERFGGDEWSRVRDLLHSIYEWGIETDAPSWDAREWRHYIVVEIAPDEVSVPDHVRDDSVQGRLRRRLNVGNIETDPRVEAQRELVYDCLDRIEARVLGGIDDCSGERIGAAEHATLLRRYWTGDDQPVTADDALDTVALDARCAPAQFDARDGRVDVDGNLARTFWIADYPTEPEACALREVVTMQGVDVDLSIRLRPRDKEDRLAELQHEIGSADAEALEREEETDPSALDADDAVDALVKQYQTLRQTPSQPWRLATYVTIRADTDRALDEALGALDRGVSTGEEFRVGVAKRRALDSDTDRVRKALEGTPAELITQTPTGRQTQLFRAASPTGRDAFDDASTADRYRDVLGGTVGALVPFLGVSMQADSGVRYGRALQNGREVVADPFDRGGAPHQLTIGKSGGGKTYSTQMRAMRWWLADPDRTLIFCDTKGEFADVVDALNGEHIVVDGSRTINPLEIRASAAETAAATDVDPYRLKIDEAREFVAGILRGQGVDPGRYVATIEESLEATYRDAGIRRDDPETFACDSPTMADYLDVLDRMSEEPEAYTYGAGGEAKTIQTLASELLTKLSGFKSGGKYDSLVGESHASITPGGVSYLDLRQVGSEGAEKSTMLSLMLGQVNQTIKQAPGQTMFVVDEAHYLLHSTKMVEWLQRAARQWRALDASMWLVSQSPQDFVGTGHNDADAHRKTITGQCSTVEFFRTESLDWETARRFGMNDRQHEFVRNQATGGEKGLGFSQAMVSFSDRDGWIRTQIEASPAEDAVLSGGDAA